MRKLLIHWLCGTSVILAACSSQGNRDDDDTSFVDRWTIVHKPEIQQGNIITQEMINQLSPGMEKRQVRYVLGTPLLVDVFHQDRWDYYYSLKEPRRPATKKRISLFFSDNRLNRIEGDLRPEPAKDTESSADLVVDVPDYEPENKGIITWILEKLGWGSD